jgi:hypothetical protein
MKMGIRDSLIDKNKTQEVRQLRDKKGDKTGTRGKTANHSQGGRCPVYRRNSDTPQNLNHIYRMRGN